MKNIVKKKKKGFTLIELLAVIIILGILMIIAIPAVTKYINESRKKTYVNTAKRIMEGTINLANSESLNMIDSDTTYYIPSSYIKTENDLKSPYGEFTEAYVGVVLNNSNYEYFWISNDTTGTGVKYVKSYDELDIDDIKENLNDLDIRNTIETTGIGSRTKIKIFNIDTETWDSYNAEYSLNEGIIFESGKNRSNSTMGDFIKIGDEGFNIVNNEDNRLTLLAQYNLKVGSFYSFNPATVEHEYSRKESGYGMQSNEMTGFDNDIVEAHGVLQFSDTNYWFGKVSLTGYYTGEYDFINNPYVFDENSTLYSYVKEYASKLDVNVKEFRLLTYQEAISLGCDYSLKTCQNAPSFLSNTSYWLGSARGGSSTWFIEKSGEFNGNRAYNYPFRFGIRPVIVI